MNGHYAFVIHWIFKSILHLSTLIFKLVFIHPIDNQSFKFYVITQKVIIMTIIITFFNK